MLFRSGAAGLSNDRLAEVFDEWNRGELDSYLIEITRDIFTVRDPASGGYLVDLILDRAGAKGTGKWMSQLALDLGVPSTLVTEAVYARSLSAMKEARVRAAGVLAGPAAARGTVDADAFVGQVRQALYASKIASYAQGFVQLAAAAREHGWRLDFRSIAMLWRGGCIIRARFLERIAEDADAFLASMDDREAAGPDIVLPDGTTVKRLPGFNRWMWDDGFVGAIGMRWSPGTEELQIGRAHV